MTRRPGARGRTLAAAALLLAAVAPAPACGGDDDGPGGTTRSAVPSVPLEWGAGDRLGVLVVDEDRRSLDDLTLQSCNLDGGFVTASAAGSRIVGAIVDECRVVARDRSLRAGASSLQPACAGALRWTFGGDAQTIMSCPSTLPDLFELSCVDFRDITGVSVASMPGEADGDLIGSLSLAVDRPSLITITLPQAPGVGLGVWPAGELVVRWEPGEGDGVEVALGAQDGSGDIVECYGPDDGELVVPSSLVEGRRVFPSWLRVARVKQSTRSVDGFLTSLSYRRSDTIYLNPP